MIFASNVHRYLLHLYPLKPCTESNHRLYRGSDVHGSVWEPISTTGLLTNHPIQLDHPMDAPPLSQGMWARPPFYGCLGIIGNQIVGNCWGCKTHDIFPENEHADYRLPFDTTLPMRYGPQGYHIMHPTMHRCLCKCVQRTVPPSPLPTHSPKPHSQWHKCNPVHFYHFLIMSWHSPVILGHLV